MKFLLKSQGFLKVWYINDKEVDMEEWMYEKLRIFWKRGINKRRRAPTHFF